ncbi:MAG: hypothetical protein LBJ64_00520 [Deltaproteobacteria bacterium]|jgi:hypothetical protein|nr:hypothetical protein [Deltaproteobacteria bacterium]
MARKPSLSSPALLDLDDRLECYGTYNSLDDVCRSYCALALNCALIKEDLTSRDITDNLFLPYSVSGPHECQ